jgi:hypothetical protein
MRNYKAGGKWHKVYDPDDTLPEGLIVQSNWKEAEVGDWVKADDDCIIQILRKGTMLRRLGKNKVREYVGTCTGTFPISAKMKMDTSKRADIYSFSGRKAQERLEDRESLNKHEKLFVAYLSKGVGMQEAYLKAFPTNNPRYALEKAGTLTQTTRILTAMKEELKPVMEELDLDEAFVLKNIKEVILSSEKDDTRLKALFKLADIMDMEDKNKTQVTQLTAGVFQGFTENKLDEVKRPKELE